MESVWNTRDDVRGQRHKVRELTRKNLLIRILTRLSLVSSQEVLASNCVWFQTLSTRLFERWKAFRHVAMETGNVGKRLKSWLTSHVRGLFSTCTQIIPNSFQSVPRVSNAPKDAWKVSGRQDMTLGVNDTKLGSLHEKTY